MLRGVSSVTVLDLVSLLTKVQNSAYLSDERRLRSKAIREAHQIQGRFRVCQKNEVLCIATCIHPPNP